ncbi:MAG: hypothetical protein ABW169_15925 [Sphingobium sp.]
MRSPPLQFLGLLPLLILPALAACDRKPGFDEKYEEQAKHISTTANSIERQVADQMSGAAEAERAAAETAARTPTPGNSPSLPGARTTPRCPRRSRNRSLRRCRARPANPRCTCPAPPGGRY